MTQRRVETTETFGQTSVLQRDATSHLVMNVGFLRLSNNSWNASLFPKFAARAEFTRHVSGLVVGTRFPMLFVAAFSACLQNHKEMTSIFFCIALHCKWGYIGVTVTVPLMLMLQQLVAAVGELHSNLDMESNLFHDLFQKRLKFPCMNLVFLRPVMNLVEC